MVSRPFRPGVGVPPWFDAFTRHLDGQLRRIGRAPFRTVATAGDPATNQGALIVVTDETGGPTLAWSDGTDWRRTADNAVIS